MKSNSPRKLAAWIAGLFTIVFAGVYVIFDLGWIPGRSYTYVLAGVLIFIFLYLVLSYVIRTFIYEKILPIYRVIRKSGTGISPEKKALSATNPIEEIYLEVDDWARTKTTEIEQLRANEKFRQEFIGNVSHELKTPIFNIQGYILTLLEGGLEDKSINRLYLEKAEKSINRMIQIVKDLEYIARIESGELELHMERFDIRKLVDEVFELHEMRAKKNKIRLLQVYKPERTLFVRADRKRILEVISNLVVNGIHYGKKGGAVTVDFLDMERHILVEVKDDGMGIEAHHQKRIFERFYRVDQSRSRDQGGTGLGLAIVKHFIEAHGQTIHLQSEKGSGTSFTFTLDKG